MPTPAVEDLVLTPDLVCVEPWDEEGYTPEGIWVDHSWEDVAGHAFGRVITKASYGESAYSDVLLSQIQPGDLVLFTRAAHVKVVLEWGGQDTKLLFVNVNDIQAVLKEEDGGEESNRVDGAGAS